MSSALESSITLDDVFVVVGARRVPLAAELAGYLALEIAEGATQANGDVDPRTVYIGEEGSVALVMRPRREQASGDAEASIRALLARLLDASGSQTPALASAARRRPSVGMHLLVEELEAALIPVNRAAGRRALARLAREVKRVTLGVGRNASLAPGEPPPRRGSSPSHTAGRDVPRSPQDDARPPPRSAGDELPVAARAIAEPTPPPPPAAEPSVIVAPPSAPDASELPTMEVRKSRFAAAPPVEPTPAPRGADEVDHLLASFGVSARGDHSQRNELKALVGLEPTPPPPGSEVPPDSVRGDSDVESLLAISESAPPVAARPAVLASPPTAISPVLANEPFRASGRAAATQTPPTVPSPSSPLLPQPRGTREPRASEPEERAPLPGTRGVPTAPSARRIAEMTSQPNIAPDRSLTVFALVVVVVCGVAVWLLRPVLFAGSEPHAVPSASVAAPVLIAPAPPRCRASLIVTGAPPSAEILVRAGQAPVDVERMPVGARLEFVATAEGYAPKRAVVPSGATWDSGPDGKPRYEVAVQLDRSRARAGGVDPWPAGEPGSEVGGKGSPGTVHLVTTPRGAEVWQLAALGPDAQFDVRCGGDVELLIAGPTTLRRRLRVAEAEFTTLDGGTDRQATVNAK